MDIMTFYTIFVFVYLFLILFVGSMFFSLYKNKTSKKEAWIMAFFTGFTWFAAPFHMSYYETYAKKYWQKMKLR